MSRKGNFNSAFFKILDWLAALIAWLIFFIFRRSYVDNYIFEFSQLLSDKNFNLGLLLLPLVWVLWYSFTGQYYKSYRQSRLKTIFRTFWQSLLGVLAIFFILLLDDNVTIYTKYYATFSFLLIASLIFFTDFIDTIDDKYSFDQSLSLAI